ncbi:MAG: ATP phosphoribosyltransferase regulatory subunit [Proteobacteria bacterium]|nr:ATP phosphoribosyltransferase regulatory subunit [Burkholderiales bacterium]
MRNWLLPAHIEDVLPPVAQRVESFRRRLLELLRTHGYQLVMPPLLEYVDSLRVGTGVDLDLKTFKLVDQVSGRLMGLRADITPQVARIDAYLTQREGVARYAYCSSVLHTLPASDTGRRELLQLGAELFGHSTVESDIEIQQLMLKALAALGVEQVHLDLGHVAVFRALAARAQIDAPLESRLFAALQSKDVPLVHALSEHIDAPWREALRRLPHLYGDDQVLAAARSQLPSLPEIARALAELAAMAAATPTGAATLHFDLAELRGYHYHSGVVFAAYIAGHATAIAGGGRYDDVGRAFGRARPATGFSLDLFDLASIIDAGALPGAVLAPADVRASLNTAIEALRAAGEVVVVDLPGTDRPIAELNCDRALVERDGAWRVEPLRA